MNRPPVAVVVIPTYNEGENIGPLLERVSKVRGQVTGYKLEVLFVDDSSPDGTSMVVADAAKEYEYVHLLVRSGKRGLGTAYLEGFARAIEDFDPAAFIQIDADLQHPPELIPQLLLAIRGGKDVALASRRVKGGGSTGWSRRRVLVNSVANWLAGTVLGLEQKDLTSGYKAFSRRMVEDLIRVKMRSAGFSYQVETLQVAKKAKMQVEEIPYVFEVRKRGRSKLTLADIFGFLKNVAMMRLRPTRSV